MNSLRRVPVTLCPKHAIQYDTKTETIELDTYNCQACLQPGPCDEGVIASLLEEYLNASKTLKEIRDKILFQVGCQEPRDINTSEYQLDVEDVLKELGDTIDVEDALSQLVGNFESINGFEKDNNAYIEDCLGTFPYDPDFMEDGGEE